MYVLFLCGTHLNRMNKRKKTKQKKTSFDSHHEKKQTNKQTISLLKVINMQLLLYVCVFSFFLSIFSLPIENTHTRDVVLDSLC